MFHITCTTCEARLKVRDESAIGAILACPKCGGMVEVTAPEEATAEPEQQIPPASPETLEPPPLPPESDAKPPEPPESAPPPPAPPTEPFAPRTDATSATERTLKKWLLLGAIPVVLLVLVGVVAMVLPKGGEEASPPDRAITAEPEVEEPQVAEPTSPFTPESRGLADALRTNLTLGLSVEPDIYYSVRVSQFPSPTDQTRMAARTMVAGQFSPPASLDALIEFDTTAEAVDRYHWMSAGNSEATPSEIALLELLYDEGLPASPTESIGLSVAGVPCGRLSEGTQRPFVALDERTLVTANQEFLAGLESAGEPAEPTGFVAEQLAIADRTSDLLLIVHGEAMRSLKEPLVESLFQWIPELEASHRRLIAAPDGLVVTLPYGESPEAQVILVCQSEDQSTEVIAALTDLQSQLDAFFRAELESINAVGDRTEEQGDQQYYRSLVERCLTAIQAIEHETLENHDVVVRVHATPSIVKLLTNDAWPLNDHLATIRPLSLSDEDAVSPPPETTTDEEPETPLSDNDLEGMGIRRAEDRLAMRLERIDFPKVTLAGAVETLAQLAGLPVTWDFDALEQQGASLGNPLNRRLEDMTLDEGLTEILAGYGLVRVIEANQLLVTTPPETRATLTSTTHSVGDLVDSVEAAETLAWNIARVVKPESWQTAGGQGLIEVDGPALKIAQTADVQYQVEVFCERLRAARGLPLRTKRDARSLGKGTRLDGVRTRMAQPVSLNYHQATPLREILAMLEGMAGLRIRVNWIALAEQGLTAEVEGKHSAAEQPFGQALGDLLAPLKLDYRIIDNQTLEVTTATDAARRLEIEFHPFDAMLGLGVVPDRMQEKIEEGLEPESWQSRGGHGLAYFDEPSRCLIVLQTDEVQTLLQMLLEQAAEQIKTRLSAPSE